SLAGRYDNRCPPNTGCVGPGGTPPVNTRGLFLGGNYCFASSLVRPEPIRSQEAGVRSHAASLALASSAPSRVVAENSWTASPTPGSCCAACKAAAASMRDSLSALVSRTQV